MIGGIFLLLIIALAVLVGCYVGQQHLYEINTLKPNLSPDYFRGLNYLINEQSDKAVDVFTKLLAVDPETIELHLAVGSVFRRRGETTRAIKIHQNIMARPQLPALYRTTAMIALGQDYLSAGLIDRAERLFLAAISSGEQLTVSLAALLKIYQQQKNWLSAIKIAQQLDKLTGKPQTQLIAHFYCELAQIAWQKNDWVTVQKYSKLALKLDSLCVRASLLQGKLALQQKDYVSAIQYLENILNQDKTFFNDALADLIIAYRAMHQEEKLIHYLATNCLLLNSIDVVLYLTEMQLKKDKVAAIHFLTTYLETQPSIRGLHYLMQWQAQLSHNDSINLSKILQRLMKQQPNYQCYQCGFKSSVVSWLCPGCEHWGSIRRVN